MRPRRDSLSAAANEGNIMERKNKREWVIKATFPNGTVECGSPLTKAEADSWAKKMNHDYPFIKHEVVLADLVGVNEGTAANGSSS